MYEHEKIYQPRKPCCPYSDRGCPCLKFTFIPRADINVMTKRTMDQIGLVHTHPTPTVLELVDRSKIKPKGVLDDVIVSLYFWEYLVDFIVLHPNNPVGAHPLIFG